MKNNYGTISMSLIVPLFMAVLAHSGCAKGTKKNGWIEEKLNGKVHQIQQRTYSCSEKFGEVVKGYLADWGHYDMEFDEEGNRIQKKYFDSRGEFTSLDKYYHNSQNLDTLIIGYTKYGSLVWRQERLFDKKHNLIETRNLNSDGTIDRVWKTTFNDQNLEIRSDGYDRNGSLIFQWMYEYDESGNCVSKSLNNVAENRSSATQYRFDENNNIIESKGYVMTTFKYVYDEKKNWISRTEFHNNEATEITERSIKYW